MSYDPRPTYPLAHGRVSSGYAGLARRLVEAGRRRVAIDGPPALDWDTVGGFLRQALLEQGVHAELVDIRRAYSWADVLAQTAPSELPGDPIFARLHGGTVADLIRNRPRVHKSRAAVVVLLGPGSSTLDHDLLWYFDLPKRDQLGGVRAGSAGNLGMPPGMRGSEPRLLFIDWPMLDRHVRSTLHGLDLFASGADSAVPRWVDGDNLRATLSQIAAGPFRTLPTFFPGPWGGTWLRSRLGIETDEANLAWSYELITPESSLLIGEREPVEVPFELLLAAAGGSILGPDVELRFGGAFPIRFDYLDTLEGGNLSIQCHPREAYMREVFGLDYTQLETYYVLETTPGAKVFLGLRDDADVAAFERATRRAAAGTPFDPLAFIAAHPAVRHQLYLIPAGTPHASGEGNVVLEVSATPYLYTLRFYDWLRRNAAGELRPVHVGHAFANLDVQRRETAVRKQLIQSPRTVRAGDGWTEVSLGDLDDLFYRVHRLEFDTEVADDTRGRFHALNLVAGERVEVETASGRRHELSYAESLVVPATVGPYRIRRLRGGPCMVVKAFVK